uniref:ATP synthase F0 subunit 8 n=1 Tax=Labyrinthula sp. TaxID=1678526 RepID=A0A7S6U9Q4_9STRA|nr:ATP synthase F0 subunit 8 [Labyrinthula sp.]
MAQLDIGSYQAQVLWLLVVVTVLYVVVEKSIVPGMSRTLKARGKKLKKGVEEGEMEEEGSVLGGVYGGIVGGGVKGVMWKVREGEEELERGCELGGGDEFVGYDEGVKLVRRGG